MKSSVLAVVALALLALAGTSEAHGYRRFQARSYHAPRIFVFGSFYAPSYAVPYVPVEVVEAVPAPAYAPEVVPAPVAAPVLVVPVYETRYRFFRDAYGRLFRQAYRVRVK